MTARDKGSSAHSDCDRFADLSRAAAWEEAPSPEFTAHLSDCAACAAAFRREQAFADRCHSVREEIPAPALTGLAEQVKRRTTRTPVPDQRWRWAVAAAGVAAGAFAVFRALRPRPQPEQALFADVDLDLLENLELAENLELLQVLDALEVLDDG